MNKLNMEIEVTGNKENSGIVRIYHSLQTTIAQFFKITR